MIVDNIAGKQRSSTIINGINGFHDRINAAEKHLKKILIVI